ncbi:MAG: acyloxyacyl hydrolase [Acidobacteria bacterium]|nr:acyloxyacyl hydrolase [Acidobacteriota bacterium]MBV9624249.1 acyloxyacyl hydrolase [Acidobacteriota bacterium]
MKTELRLSIAKTKPAVLLMFTTLLAGSMCAQLAPETGGNEIQLWTSGGHSVPGGRSQTGIWNMGLRYGWILTDAHGPAFLRGKFEYAIDAVPAYLIFQPVNTSYGVGLNPLNLRWDLAQRGRLLPYFELSGGVLFTTHTVPPHTSAVNFTPAAAFGVYLLKKKRALALEARYLHISNAGLSRLNPGINTLEVRLGVGKFHAGR